MCWFGTSEPSETLSCCTEISLTHQQGAAASPLAVRILTLPNSKHQCEIPGTETGTLETCLLKTQISKPRFIFHPMKTGALKTDNQLDLTATTCSHDMGQLWQIWKDQVCFYRAPP